MAGDKGGGRGEEHNGLYLNWIMWRETIRDNETTIFHTEGGCAPLTSALREIPPFWRQQELFRQGLQPGRRATGWFFFHRQSQLKNTFL